MVDREARTDITDRMLWQRGCVTDVPEDDGARYLDLAAFADGRLDADERERVAEWLQSHPEAAGDIEAARALARTVTDDALSETAIARACALVGDTGSSRRNPVVAFHTRKIRRPVLAPVAQWSGLAAALVVAGWLGFTLGMDASGMIGPSRAGSDDGIAQDLFGPSRGFFRDLTGGV